MERFERAFSWVRTITAGILIVSFGSIEEAVSEVTKGHGPWLLLMTLIVASVLFRVIEKIIESSVENIRLLRKWIAGKHFIEGYWKDLVRDETSGTIYAGIVFIYYEDGRLRVSGQDFDSGGVPIAAFRATATEYNDGELRFIFRSERESGESAGGVSRYIFSMSESIPLSFRGEFFDSVSKTKFKVHGERIVDKSELEECAKQEGNAALVAQAHLKARNTNLGKR